MAYFSNGNEGAQWRESNCDICPLGDYGCPIEGAHMLHNYAQLVDGKQEGPLAEVLGLLVPQREDGFAGECALKALLDEHVMPYVDVRKKEREQQASLFGVPR